MAYSDGEKPKLTTRTAVLVFSFLLSTIFGALLFAQNLKEIGKSKAILNIILFSIFWNIIILKILDKIIHNGLIVYGITNILGGLILIIPFWNYYLKEIVDYKSRKIWGPLVVFLVMVGAYILLILFSKNR
ncbi:MAG TPA: hypothetical protein VGK38_01360 [Prolixibacteraceae bacterium]|jgi:hypothetical protein